jgi:hypothetical protein
VEIPTQRKILERYKTVMSNQIENSPDFVELNRRFIVYSGNNAAEESALESYASSLLGREPGLGWNELLKKRIVVILGEAGSGKTRELQHRCELLQKEGKTAIHLRLDELVNHSFNSALHGNNVDCFKKWKYEDAIFFLDSVDESKLQKNSDFYGAIDNICDAIGKDRLHQSQFIISSRVSEWQPETDKNELIKRLSVLIKTTKPKEVSDNKIPELYSFNQNVINKKNEDVLQIEDTFNVVILQPLNKNQVVKYAQWKDVVDVNEFIRALDRHYAWEFARRPYDVNNLIEYWKSNGKLGTLTELVEHSLDSNLNVPDKGRELPLSRGRVRDGAEQLAAASILCRILSFRVDDQAALVEGALSPQNCLPADWKYDEFRSLRQRSIFDSATYGTFRFHHRRTIEYLTSKWIEKRCNDGCPKEEIESLLFEHINNVRIVKQSLIPVVAWLCCGDEPWKKDVRSWALNSAPEIFLQYGDSERLPVEFKKDLFNALLGKFKNRKNLWIETDPLPLSRIVTPESLPKICYLIKNKSISIDLREIFIEMLRFGKHLGVFNQLLDILADIDTPTRLRTLIAATIRDDGNISHRKRLVEIALQFKTIPEYLCAFICEATFPSVIDTNKLLILLKKTEKKTDSNIGISFHLIEHFKEVLAPEKASEVLVILTELGQSLPHKVHEEGITGVSSKYNWVGDVIPNVLEILLRKENLTEHECDVASQSIRFLEKRRHVGNYYDEEIKEINELTYKHLELRRKYFWTKFNELKEKRTPHSMYEVLDHYDILKENSNDIEWLILDIAQRENKEKVEIAFKFALRIVLSMNGKSSRYLYKLIKCICWDKKLFEIFKSYFRQRLFGPIIRLWNRQVKYKLMHKWWWDRQKDKYQALLYWLTNQVRLQRNINYLRSGEKTDWLVHLVKIANVRNHNSWTANNWNDLKNKYGKRITQATKTGCKNIIYTFIPTLPHDSERNIGRNEIILGLNGIKLLIDEEDLDLKNLSDKDAGLFTKYALNEIDSWPTWFYELARNCPQGVKEVLKECVKKEWKYEADRKHPYEVIYKISWHREELIPLVENEIIELLRIIDPPNNEVFIAALSILLERPENNADLLKAIASNRVNNYASNNPRFLIWLNVWFNLDAKNALEFLRFKLKEKGINAKELMERLCVVLKGGRVDRLPTTENPDFNRPRILKELIPLVYEYVRPEDDVHHEGIYTPSNRDDAEQFRGMLFQKLAINEDKETDGVLKVLVSNRSLKSTRDYILHVIESRAKRFADGKPWDPSDINSFRNEYEISPKTDRDLFRLIVKRLIELKNEVELSDNSPRIELSNAKKEYELRKWLARKLDEKRKNKYNAVQEPEVDPRNKVDIRIFNPNTDPVSIEIKWANKWTLRELVVGLQDQLVGKYLRAHNSKYGIYLVGVRGNKKAWHNLKGKQLDFGKVLEVLSKKAEKIQKDNSGVEGLKVIGIDFRESNRKDRYRQKN